MRFQSRARHPSTRRRSRPEGDQDDDADFEDLECRGDRRPGGEPGRECGACRRQGRDGCGEAAARTHVAAQGARALQPGPLQGSDSAPGGFLSELALPRGALQPRTVLPARRSAGHGGRSLPALPRDRSGGDQSRGSRQVDRRDREEHSAHGSGPAAKAAGGDHDDHRGAAATAVGDREARAAQGRRSAARAGPRAGAPLVRGLVGLGAGRRRSRRRRRGRLLLLRRRGAARPCPGVLVAGLPRRTLYLAHQNDVAGTWLTVGGAGLVLAGVALLWWNPAPRRKPGQTSAQLSVGPGWLGVQGTF